MAELRWSCPACTYLNSSDAKIKKPFVLKYEQVY